jgi:hypothetical protein
MVLFSLGLMEIPVIRFRRLLVGSITSCAAIANQILSTTMAVLLLLSAAPVNAQADYSVCSSSGVAFGFFNGVRTTTAQAQASLEALALTYGANTPNGQKITYYLFYNSTANAQDFLETFEQRVVEQQKILDGRYEFFWESLQGGGPLTDRIGQVVPSVAGTIFDYATTYLSKLIVNNLRLIVSEPPTSATYDEFEKTVDGMVNSGSKMLFFAHSQGNLFGNHTYDYAVSKVGTQSVSMINVAPASPTIRGAAILADLDIVINALRVTGTVPVAISDTIPIPNPANRVAGLNGGKDALGHGLLEIYLNLSHLTSGRLKTVVSSAITSLGNSASSGNMSGNLFEVTFTGNNAQLVVDEPTIYDRATNTYRNPITGVLDNGPLVAVSQPPGRVPTTSGPIGFTGRFLADSTPNSSKYVVPCDAANLNRLDRLNRFTEEGHGGIWLLYLAPSSTGPGSGTIQINSFGKITRTKSLTFGEYKSWDGYGDVGARVVNGKVAVEFHIP